MEIPLVPGGTASCTRTRESLEISVPSKKELAGGCFLCFWLCGWLIGETFASFAIFAPRTPLPVKFVLLFWLTFWTFVGLTAFYTAVRSLMDRQVIILTSRHITITAVLWSLRIPVAFPLGKVRNIRSVEGGTSMNNIIKDTGKTLLAFDYCGLPIKSLVAMEPHETLAMMKIMKESGYLGLEHFHPETACELRGMEGPAESAEKALSQPPAAAAGEKTADSEDIEIDEEVTEYEEGEPEGS